jgi:single-strand DNA-binding protein
MSSSVNKVILVGRLGKDPEVRYTQGGKAVANFSIATDESYKDNDGEKQKKTEWHNIVVWGNSVEAFVQKYLHKGDMVYIEGKLQTRSWDDKDGNKKYTTEINVFDIKGLITAKSDDQPATSSKKTTTNKPATRAAEPEDDSSDIPF